MHIYFCMLPAHGHINPTLSVAHELISRGHHVTYFSVAEYKETIESSGANMFEVSEEVNPTYLLKNTNPSEIEKDPSKIPEIFQLNEGVAENVLDIAKRERPDIIVYDPMCSWGKEAASQYDGSAATFSTSFAITEKTLDVLESKMPFNRQVAEKLFIAREKLNIVPVPEAFQPSIGMPNDRFSFVGPLSPYRQEFEDNELQKLFVHETRPIIYISLGTVVSNLDFYRTCISALKDSEVHVLLKLGKDIDIKDLGDIPVNFTVRSFYPQLQVLKHADVFVTHGGINSVMEGLSKAVPLIVMPHMADQPLNAEQVTQLGLGETLNPKSVTAEEFTATVQSLLDNNEMKAKLLDMKEQIESSGGASKAADLIEQSISETSMVK